MQKQANSIPTTAKASTVERAIDRLEAIYLVPDGDTFFYNDEEDEQLAIDTLRLAGKIPQQNWSNE